VKLAQSALKGMIWAYASFFGGRLLNMITTVVLARLLVPAEIGLVGFAIIVLNFIESARSFGVNDALIYNDKRVEDAADTAFLLNIAIGLLQYSIAFAVAPLAVHFIDDVRIVTIVRVMSFAFVINSFGQVNDAMLQKELQFRRRFIPELSSVVIKGTVSIGAAFLGFGVWSIVIGHVIGAISRTTISWLVVRWRPRFRFYADKARELWHYGIHILMLNALSIAVDQADPLMVGTLLGTVQLGYYTIASKLPDLIVVNLSLVLTRVIFPAYVKMKNDREMLTRSYLTTTKYTVMLTAAAAVGMSAVAPELMRVLFPGGKWAPAIPLLQVLAFSGLAATLAWNAGDVFKAIGRPDISTKLLLIDSLYTFALIYFMASRSGLALMAALANMIAYFMSAVIRLYLTSRFLKFSPTRYIGVYRGTFAAAINMYAAVSLWRTLTATWAQSLTLVTSVLVGAVVYIGILWMIERQALKDAIAMVRSLIRSRSEAAPASPIADPQPTQTFEPDIAIGPDSLLEPTIIVKRRAFDLANQPTIVATRQSPPESRDDRTVLSRRRSLGLHNDQGKG
jgi:O-antigen/teichoic acid export membrane protein